MAFYDNGGLAAPRLCFTRSGVIWLACAIKSADRTYGLFRTPGCSFNLNGFGKTRPRAEVQTYQRRSGRSDHQDTGWSIFIWTCCVA